MASKIIYLLIPLMTPIAFFLAAQITYDHGVLGLLGYSIMWALSFIAFYFTQNRKPVAIQDPILRSVIKGVYIIEVIFCIFLVLKIIFTETDFIYMTLINIILMATVPLFVIYLYKFNPKLVAVATVLLGIAISFLIPTLVYLKVSIPTVYSGIHFLSTDLLRFDRPATWLLVASLGIILVARQYLYRMVDIHHKARTRFAPFLIAAIISSIVMISFGTISFLGRAQAVLPDLSDRVSIQVINRFGGQFAQILFMSITIFMIFFIFITLWESIKGGPKKYNPLLIVIGTLIPGLVVPYVNITLLDAFLYFGLFWSPLFGLIFVPVTTIYRTRIGFLFGLCMSLAVGLIFTIPFGILAGACSSFLLSIVLVLFGPVEQKNLQL
ncbi:hypothetical protein AB1K83_13580 [Sporosarcina sp. 179-K 3D1 HS]|uniref:hypothetical protein n=1 Tax=Sporosarcina sp. 179-K 3D1 HS TaxID=3232169 RepID=UPI0039A1460A